MIFIIHPRIVHYRLSSAAWAQTDGGACALPGKAKYDAKKHALVWKIKRFTGSAEQILIANVELIATTKEKKPWSRPPISLNFQVSGQTLRETQHMQVWNVSWGGPRALPVSIPQACCGRKTRMLCCQACIETSLSSYLRICTRMFIFPLAWHMLSFCEALASTK